MKRNNVILIICLCYLFIACRSRTDSFIIEKSTIVLFYDTAFSNDAAFVSEMHVLEIMNGKMERELCLDSAFIYTILDSNRLSLRSAVISNQKTLHSNSSNTLALFPLLDKEVAFAYPPDSAVLNRMLYLDGGYIIYGLVIGDSIIEVVPEEVEILKCPKESGDYMCIGKELYDRIH